MNLILKKALGLGLLTVSLIAPTALAAGTVQAAAPVLPVSGLVDPDSPEKPASEEKTPSTKPGDKKDDKGEAKDKEEDTAGKPTRIAILNFGPPRSWQGEVDGMVGQEINAFAWKQALPLLKKDKVKVVVVRINSGGGYTLEREKFLRVFEEYKRNFRVVTWIESAISCAAMSPWSIEEMYFLPEGNIGGCTEWHGDLVLSNAASQETRLMEMEEASRMANRDPKIMRAMQIMEPLSCNIDEFGNVKWFQDLSGKIIVNRPGEILTLTASVAMQTKFGKGIASNVEELAKAMGIQEFEVAGKEATKFIDQNMRDCDRTAKRIREVDAKYVIALNAAEALRGDPAQGAAIGRARQALNQMKSWMSVNPNFEFIFRRPKAWFDEQEDILKRLQRTK